MKEILLYIAIPIASFFVLLAVLLIIFRVQKIKRKFREKYSVVQVRVSRENETGPIAAEQMFATLHGIQSKFSFWQKLKGYSSDNISFEIASIGRVLKFHVAFPDKLRNLVEGQIYAQYADVEINDCPDYSLLPRFEKYAEQAVGVELNFKEADIFPVKRFPQFEDKLARVAVDPISAITSALLKFDHPDDQAWIQIVVTPLADKWRIVFSKCVKILHKGIFANVEAFTKFYARAFCTRALWPRIIFFPIYMVLWVQGFMANAKIKMDVLVDKTVRETDMNESTTSRAHEKESHLDAAMDKVVRLLFDTTIRIVHIPINKDRERAETKVREIHGAFKQFSLPYLNAFNVDKGFLYGKGLVDAYHTRLVKDGMVLNNEELATIYHMPTLMVKTPNIYWVSSKKLEPPVNLPPEEIDGEKTTILGRTNFRGNKHVFGVKPIDRRRHIYIIGKTGMGKSTVLENMIYSDIVAGKGVGVIDPHGDLADSVLDFIPSNRINDVILVDPSDREYAVAFNMLENVDPALSSIVCSGLVGIFKKIYAESWGPRLEHILRNTILALLEYPGTTMLGIIRMLSDEDFRWKVVRHVQDPVVKSFWLDEFAKMQDKIRVEAISPIQNKVGQFLSSSTIRNIVGQPKSSVSLRFAMDKGKIVIVNLSKGKIGEDNSALLGAMFITKFQLDAMSRADVPEEKRKDFYLYVDEFQNFATESFATILSEARKYRLNLTMANQYIAQMPEEVRDAVFGNVGSIFSFQVGYDDAEYLALQYGEQVLPNDLVSLSKYSAYMKLLIDGMPTQTFSLDTLPPPHIDKDPERIEKVRKVSRERYAKPVSVIEDKIKRWSSNRGDREDANGSDDEDDPAPEYKKKNK